MAPWGAKPRHRTWASDTVITGVMASVVIVAYMAWELFSPPAPSGMVTLVGLAGGALFGAATRDTKKRADEVAATGDRAEHKAEEAGATADRAEAKADALTEVAQREHPETTKAATPPLDPTGTGGSAT